MQIDNNEVFYTFFIPNITYSGCFESFKAALIVINNCVSISAEVFVVL